MFVDEHVVLAVASYLSVEDCFQCAFVCKSWRLAFISETFWKTKYITDFESNSVVLELLASFENHSWRQAYRVRTTCCFDLDPEQTFGGDLYANDTFFVAWGLHTGFGTEKRQEVICDKDGNSVTKMKSFPIGSGMSLPNGWRLSRTTKNISLSTGLKYYWEVALCWANPGMFTH